MVFKAEKLIAQGLQLHRDGFIGDSEAAGDFINFIAKYGEQKDFDALPLWAQEEVRKRIAKYQLTHSWTILTSEGTMDMAEVAELFIRRINI